MSEIRQFSLQHITIEPEAPAGDTHPTVIMLHGLGADEHDLAGLSQYLDSRLLTISVRAPFPLEWGGYKWYDFRESGQPDPDFFKESFERLSSFVNEAMEYYPIMKEHVYLLGFSMGSVMSLAMALSRPGMFRGVAANSGYLAEETHLHYDWRESGATEFFVAHGLFDQVIPVQASRIIKERLEAAGTSLEYHEFPMAHEISSESLDAMTKWFSRRIDQAYN